MLTGSAWIARSFWRILSGDTAIGAPLGPLIWKALARSGYCNGVSFASSRGFFHCNLLMIKAFRE
jgi:hypothetical protein